MSQSEVGLLLSLVEGVSGWAVVARTDRMPTENSVEQPK